MPGNELIGNLEYQEVKKYLKKVVAFYMRTALIKEEIKYLELDLLRIKYQNILNHELLFV